MSSPAGSGSASRSRGRWPWKPDFIVGDEPISALDVNIQAQIINLMIGLQERLGLTYLFIAHDLAVVRHISDRIYVLYLGKVMETARAEVLFAPPAASLHQHADLRRAGARGRTNPAGGSCCRGKSRAPSIRPPAAGSARAARPRRDAVRNWNRRWRRSSRGISSRATSPAWCR